MKRIYGTIQSISLVLLLIGQPVRAEPIRTTAQFLDGIRFVAHAGQAGTPYANSQVILQSLQYLGSRHLRVADNVAALDVFRALCMHGVKLLMLQDGSPSLADAKDLGRGCIDGVEGPNEINDNPARHRYAGQVGMPAILLHQEAMFHEAQAWDPSLPVLSPSQSVGAAPIGPDMSAIATLGNRHYYMSHGFPPQGGRGMLGRQSITTPAMPFWITETGYANYSAGPNEGAQAILVLETLMDGSSFGTQATYIYQLFDVCADSSNPECMYGMYRYNPIGEPTPKPVAKAIHNMTAILDDHGATAETNPEAIDMIWAGLLPNQFVDQLAGPVGDHWILLHDESMGGSRLPMWDIANLSIRPVKPNPVTVTFQAKHQFAVYDPINGLDYMQPLETGNSLRLSVGYHPILIHVMAAP